MNGQQTAEGSDVSGSEMRTEVDGEREAVKQGKHNKTNNKA